MWHVTAASLHEVDLFIGDDYTLQSFDLTVQLIGKALGIYCVVAVDKLILYLCTRIVINDSTAHGKLVKVVIGEVIDDLFHCLFFSFTCKYTIFAEHTAMKRGKFGYCCASFAGGIYSGI